MPLIKSVKNIKDSLKKLGFNTDSSAQKKKEEQQLSLKQNQQAVLHKTTPFIIQEAYKTSRTNIIFSVSGSDTKKCKIIALTSANPGEGKTTSCINLAITFAQTNAKVLVIDGDLRKPRIHQYLGVTKNNGLSTILSNQKTFEEVVHRNIRENLDLITSGAIPPNPAELLSSDAMHSLLKRLGEQYDYIFVDTPPVAVVTDAAALSKYVSGMVVVVRQDYANHESVEHAINLLQIAEAKLLGFFVNDVDVTSGGYGTYKRSYGYRYKYGYKYKYSNYGYGYGYGYRYGDSSSSGSSVGSSSRRRKRSSSKGIASKSAEKPPVSTEAVQNSPDEDASLNTSAEAIIGAQPIINQSEEADVQTAAEPITVQSDEADAPIASETAAAQSAKSVTADTTDALKETAEVSEVNTDTAEPISDEIPEIKSENNGE